MNIDELIQSKLRIVPDFPKDGIQFADITPLLADRHAFSEVIEHLYFTFKDSGFDYIAGIESRGFIFGAALAAKMNVGFIPIRKKGKLPAQVLSESYLLEYGVDTVEIHADAIPSGSKVLIVDDLLATGGTAKAASILVKRLDALVELAFIIELKELGGGTKLSDEGLTFTSLLEM